jgi:hypothetical protein
MKHERIICGVTVDDTKFYEEIERKDKEIEHLKQLYIRSCKDYFQILRITNQYKKENNNERII